MLFVPWPEVKRFQLVDEPAAFPPSVVPTQPRLAGQRLRLHLQNGLKILKL